MVESRSKYAKFYEDTIRVGKQIVEIRIQNLEKHYMFSLYVKNLQELLTIFKKYNHYPFNIYYGINSRNVEGRKKEDIENRHIFYFDIEHEGEKPIIEKDEEYKRKLLATSEHICTLMEEKYNFKPVALTQSGRGFHLYYQHEDLKRVEYEKKFAIWWKTELIKMLEKGKPFKDIKFKDSMFNISRIASAPGTQHLKYEDKPFRSILKYNAENINKLKPILDKVTVKKYLVSETKTISKKKVLTHPIMKILKLGVPMNEGFYVNNTLMFSLSLICRDARFNEEEVEELNEKLTKMGYWDGIIIPGKEYNYNESTINNWCFKNMKWCNEKKFLLPYNFLKSKIRYEVNNKSLPFEDEPLDDIWKSLKYIARFNRKYFEINRGVRIVYKNTLIEKLQKNCTEELNQFLEMNNLWNKVCLYTEGVEVRI